MTIALVPGQLVFNGTTGTGICKVTLAGTPTPGNLIVVIFGQLVTTGSPTYTAIDDNSNSLSATPNTPRIDPASSSTGKGIFYRVAPSNATPGITVTSTQAANKLDVWGLEFSGAATSSAFESGAGAGPTFGTNPNTPAITTTNDGDLLISVVGIGGGTPPMPAIAPWTGMGGTPLIASGEYYVQPTQGLQATAFTNSSAWWDGVIAAFIAAPPGGATSLNAQIWM